MIKLPANWVEWLCRIKLIQRPHFLCVDVTETPLDDEIKSNILYREIRKSYPKWAHFECPHCSERIQIPIATAPNNWTVSTDWLNRPTVSPSIWEKSTCGAHFIIRNGKLLWCSD